MSGQLDGIDLSSNPSLVYSYSDEHIPGAITVDLSKDGNNNYPASSPAPPVAELLPADVPPTSSPPSRDFSEETPPPSEASHVSRIPDEGHTSWAQDIEEEEEERLYNFAAEFARVHGYGFVEFVQDDLPEGFDGSVPGSRGRHPAQHQRKAKSQHSRGRAARRESATPLHSRTHAGGGAVHAHMTRDTRWRRPRCMPRWSVEREEGRRAQASPSEEARTDIAKLMELLNSWDTELPKEKRSKSQDKVKKIIDQRRKSENEKEVGRALAELAAQEQEEEDIVDTRGLDDYKHLLHRKICQDTDQEKSTSNLGGPSRSSDNSINSSKYQSRDRSCSSFKVLETLSSSPGISNRETVKTTTPEPSSGPTRHKTVKKRSKSSSPEKSTPIVSKTSVSKSASKSKTVVTKTSLNKANRFTNNNCLDKFNTLNIEETTNKDICQKNNNPALSTTGFNQSNIVQENPPRPFFDIENFDSTVLRKFSHTKKTERRLYQSLSATIFHEKTQQLNRDIRGTDSDTSFDKLVKAEVSVKIIDTDSSSTTSPEKESMNVPNNRKNACDPLIARAIKLHSRPRNSKRHIRSSGTTKGISPEANVYRTNRINISRNPGSNSVLFHQRPPMECIPETEICDFQTKHVPSDINKCESRIAHASPIRSHQVGDYKTTHTRHTSPNQACMTGSSTTVKSDNHKVLHELSSPSHQLVQTSPRRQKHRSPAHPSPTRQPSAHHSPAHQSSTSKSRSRAFKPSPASNELLIEPTLIFDNNQITKGICKEEFYSPNTKTSNQSYDSQTENNCNASADSSIRNTNNSARNTTEAHQQITIDTFVDINIDHPHTSNNNTLCDVIDTLIDRRVISPHNRNNNALPDVNAPQERGALRQQEDGQRAHKRSSSRQATTEKISEKVPKLPKLPPISQTPVSIVSTNHFTPAYEMSPKVLKRKPSNLSSQEKSGVSYKNHKFSPRKNMTATRSADAGVEEMYLDTTVYTVMSGHMDMDHCCGTKQPNTSPVNSSPEAFPSLKVNNGTPQMNQSYIISTSVEKVRDEKGNSQGSREEYNARGDWKNDAAYDNDEALSADRKMKNECFIKCKKSISIPSPRMSTKSPRFGNKRKEKHELREKIQLGTSNDSRNNESFGRSDSHASSMKSSHSTGNVNMCEVAFSHNDNNNSYFAESVSPILTPKFDENKNDYNILTSHTYSISNSFESINSFTSGLLNLEEVNNVKGCVRASEVTHNPYKSYQNSSSFRINVYLDAPEFIQTTNENNNALISDVTQNSLQSSANNSSKVELEGVEEENSEDQGDHNIANHSTLEQTGFKREVKVYSSEIAQISGSFLIDTNVNVNASFEWPDSSDDENGENLQKKNDLSQIEHAGLDKPKRSSWIDGFPLLSKLFHCNSIVTNQRTVALWSQQHEADKEKRGFQYSSIQSSGKNSTPISGQRTLSRSLYPSTSTPVPYRRTDYNNIHGTTSGVKKGVSWAPKKEIINDEHQHEAPTDNVYRRRIDYGLRREINPTRENFWQTAAGSELRLSDVLGAVYPGQVYEENMDQTTVDPMVRYTDAGGQVESMDHSVMLPALERAFLDIQHNMQLTSRQVGQLGQQMEQLDRRVTEGHQSLRREMDEKIDSLKHFIIEYAQPSTSKAVTGDNVDKRDRGDIHMCLPEERRRAPSVCFEFDVSKQPQCSTSNPKLLDHYQYQPTSSTLADDAERFPSTRFTEVVQPLPGAASSQFDTAVAREVFNSSEEETSNELPVDLRTGVIVAGSSPNIVSETKGTRTTSKNDLSPTRRSVASSSTRNEHMESHTHRPYRRQEHSRACRRRRSAAGPVCNSCLPSGSTSYTLRSRLSRSTVTKRSTSSASNASKRSISSSSTVAKNSRSLGSRVSKRSRSSRSTSAKTRSNKRVASSPASTKKRRTSVRRTTHRTPVKIATRGKGKRGRKETKITKSRQTKKSKLPIRAVSCHNINLNRKADYQLIPNFNEYSTVNSGNPFRSLGESQRSPQAKLTYFDTRKAPLIIVERSPSRAKLVPSYQDILEYDVNSIKYRVRPVDSIILNKNRLKKTQDFSLDSTMNLNKNKDLRHTDSSCLPNTELCECHRGNNYCQYWLDSQQVTCNGSETRIAHECKRTMNTHEDMEEFITSQSDSEFNASKSLMGRFVPGGDIIHFTDKASAGIDLSRYPHCSQQQLTLVDGPSTVHNSSVNGSQLLNPCLPDGTMQYGECDRISQCAFVSKWEESVNRSLDVSCCDSLSHSGLTANRINNITNLMDVTSSSETVRYSGILQKTLRLRYPKPVACSFNESHIKVDDEVVNRNEINMAVDKSPVSQLYTEQNKPILIDRSQGDNVCEPLRVAASLAGDELTAWPHPEMIVRTPGISTDWKIVPDCPGDNKIHSTENEEAFQNKSDNKTDNTSCKHVGNKALTGVGASVNKQSNSHDGNNEVENISCRPTFLEPNAEHIMLMTIDNMINENYTEHVVPQQSLEIWNVCRQDLVEPDNNMNITHELALPFTNIQDSNEFIVRQHSEMTVRSPAISTTWQCVVQGVKAVDDVTFSSDVKAVDGATLSSHSKDCEGVNNWTKHHTIISLECNNVDELMDDDITDSSGFSKHYNKVEHQMSNHELSGNIFQKEKTSGSKTYQNDKLQVKQGNRLSSTIFCENSKVNTQDNIETRCASKSLQTKLNDKDVKESNIFIEMSDNTIIKQQSSDSNLNNDNGFRSLIVSDEPGAYFLNSCSIPSQDSGTDFSGHIFTSWRQAKHHMPISESSTSLPVSSHYQPNTNAPFPLRKNVETKKTSLEAAIHKELFDVSKLLNRKRLRRGSDEDMFMPPNKKIKLESATTGGNGETFVTAHEGGSPQLNTAIYSNDSTSYSPIVNGTEYDTTLVTGYAEHKNFDTVTDTNVTNSIVEENDALPTNNSYNNNANESNLYNKTNRLKKTVQKQNEPSTESNADALPHQHHQIKRVFLSNDYAFKKAITSIAENGTSFSSIFNANITRDNSIQPNSRSRTHTCDCNSIFGTAHKLSCPLNPCFCKPLLSSTQCQVGRGQRIQNGRGQQLSTARHSIDSGRQPRSMHRPPITAVGYSPLGVQHFREGKLQRHGECGGRKDHGSHGARGRLWAEGTTGANMVKRKAALQRKAQRRRWGDSREEFLREVKELRKWKEQEALAASCTLSSLSLSHSTASQHADDEHSS